MNPHRTTRELFRAAFRRQEKLMDEMEEVESLVDHLLEFDPYLPRGLAEMGGTIRIDTWGDIEIDFSWDAPARNSLIGRMEAYGWRQSYDSPRQPTDRTWRTVMYHGRLKHEGPYGPTSLRLGISMTAKEEGEACKLIKVGTTTKVMEVPVYDVLCPEVVANDYANL